MAAKERKDRKESFSFVFFAFLCGQLRGYIVLKTLQATKPGEALFAGGLLATRNHFRSSAFVAATGRTVSQSWSVDSIANLVNPPGTPLLTVELVRSAIARCSFRDSIS